MEGAVHATVFIDLLAVGLVVPLLPFRGDELNLSPISFGLLSSLYGISQLAGGIIIGVAADRILGRKNALLASLFITALGYLLLMSSNSIAVFALSRIIVGFVRHTQSLSQAMISQTTISPSALARLGAVTALAWTCGTFLSGLLAGTPYGHVAPVLMAVGLLFLGTVFAAFAVKHMSELWECRGRVGFLLLVKGLLAFAALTTASGYAKDRFLLTPSSHGYLMAYSGLIAFITQSVLLPLLHRRFPELDERVAMIVAAGLLSVMSLMQFFARPGADVYMLFMLPVTLIATSFLNIHLAYLRQVPQGDAGLALGVAGALDALARAAVPTLSGVLKQWVGLRGPPLGDAALLLVLLGVLLLEPPSARPIGDIGKKD